MYWVTESAGRLGSLVVIVVACIAFGLTADSVAWKFITGFKSLIALVVMLTALAYVNENLIKDKLRIARPSHTYIIKQSQSSTSVDSVYSLVIDGRRSMLRNLIAQDTIHFKDIDPRILNHWIDEAGYSFPSGHSFNAFILASILAFSIYQYQGKRITVWSCIPMLWAVAVAFSRVAIGAHTALDVSAGAGLGLTISHTLLAIPFTRKIILPQTERFAGRYNQK